MISVKKKNDKLVIIIIIATILVFGYLLFFNVKKNTKVEISALVKERGNNYIIVADDENIKYELSEQVIKFKIAELKETEKITVGILS